MPRYYVALTDKGKLGLKLVSTRLEVDYSKSSPDTP